MKDVDLRGSHWVTLGVKDSGKSFHTNYLLRQASEPYAVFDPLGEHPDYDSEDVVFRPESISGPEAEDQLDEFLAWVADRRDRFGYVVVEEANRFSSRSGDLSGPLAELVDFNAHYDLGIGFVARRPRQLHTNLRELADYLFIFRLPGRNDRRTLNDVSAGLGDVVAEDLDRFQYVTVYPDRSYDVCGPLEANLNHSKGL